VYFRSASLKDNNPNLDDCQEGPRDGRPQAGHEKSAANDGDDPHVKPVLVRG
jgi:hypothetical protein